MITFLTVLVVIALNFLINGALFHLFYNWLLIGVIGLELPTLSFFLCGIAGVIISVLLD